MPQLLDKPRLVDLLPPHLNRANSIQNIESMMLGEKMSRELAAALVVVRRLSELLSQHRERVGGLLEQSALAHANQDVVGAVTALAFVGRLDQRERRRRTHHLVPIALMRAKDSQGCTDVAHDCR